MRSIAHPSWPAAGGRGDSSRTPEAKRNSVAARRVRAERYAPTHLDTLKLEAELHAAVEVSK